MLSLEVVTYEALKCTQAGPRRRKADWHACGRPNPERQVFVVGNNTAFCERSK